MIPQETIEQIAAANDVVELIGSYFPLKRAGTVYKALCPFHQERSPSFTVNPQRQIFKCFGCGAGGGVFKFVELYENVDFISAVRRLAERAGIRIVEEEMSAEDDQRLRMRKRLLELHRAGAEWFHRNLRKTQSAQAARDYLKNRAINLETATSWKIGYAPDEWDAFIRYAHGLGFNDAELIQSGLVKLRDDSKPHGQFYDRFRGRIMFPICNDLGEVIAFSGRILEADATAAKYVNSPETPLFIKGNVLFGLHKSKRALIEKGSAIVLEGQLDLITAFEAGIKNVIAPQGTAFTEKQARILKRYVEEVVLCFDADSAGQKAAERSLAALLDASLMVRVAQMPPGDDPDSLIRKSGAAAFEERIAAAKDFFDHQIDLQSSNPEFATPKGKLLFARRMAESVSLVADPILRDAVINKVTARLEVSAQDFRGMLKKPRKPSQTEVKPENPELVLDRTVGLLCLAALKSTQARNYLLSQPWETLLGQTTGTELLTRILKSDLDLQQPGTLNAFLSTLNGPEQAVIATLLSERHSENLGVIAGDCLRELQRRGVVLRMQAIEARLRTPGLGIQEVLELQKETLDLQRALTDIARPLSPEHGVH